MAPHLPPCLQSGVLLWPVELIDKLSLRLAFLEWGTGQNQVDNFGSGDAPSRIPSPPVSGLYRPSQPRSCPRSAGLDRHHPSAPDIVLIYSCLPFSGPRLVLLDGQAAFCLVLIRQEVTAPGLCVRPASPPQLPHRPLRDRVAIYSFITLRLFVSSPLSLARAS